MSGAIWSAAERRRLEWRRIWPRWRNRKAQLQVQGGAAISARPLALVGSYDSAEQLESAAQQFAAAAFDQVVIVRAPRPVEGGVWAKLVGWTRARWSRQVPPEVADSVFPVDLAAADMLLATGGGFVLVRSAARFHQACEIIERTGGRVGCI